MVNKALQSYATIQTLWANSGKDLIEIYAILSIKALDKVLKDGKSELDPTTLVKYFKEEYGLTNITVGAATKFLKRLEKPHDVVYKHDHKFKIKVDKLNKFREEYPYEEDLSSKVDVILEEIAQSAKEKHGLVLTKEQITDGLINFFDRYGGDIIIEQKDIKEVATIKYRIKTGSQKIRYVISEYIIAKEKGNTKEFDTILQFAIGNLVASAVSMQDFTEKNATLNDLTIYLDAPVIFNLLGLSGDVPYELSKDLIERLNKLRCRLVIGRVHFTEITSSIKYAIGLLNQEYPDLTKANRIYFNAKERGLNAHNLELILQSIDAIIKSFNIDVLEHPIKEAGYSDINEEQIRKIILDAFSDYGGKNIPVYRKRSIRRDAKVISNVLKLRAGRSGLKLNDVGGMLVSNNMVLCSAVSIAIQGKSNFRFPPVILTENLSTIIWANSSERNIELHKKQLISECVSSLRVKADMLRRFYKDIQTKHANNVISDQAYLDTITSDLTKRMLAEETFNDQSLYTDEVALDVVRRISEMNRLKAQEEAEMSKKEESESQHRLQNINSSFINKAVKRANNTTTGIGIVLAVLLISNSYGLFKGMSGIYIIVECLILILFAGWAAWNWLGWIPNHKKVWIWIAKRKYYRLNQQFGQAVKDGVEPDFEYLYERRNYKE